MRRLLFECYDRTFEGMTDSEWRVFCAICKHANDDTGGDCFPSTSLLAKESRLHKNTVPPQIKSLEEKKWIRTEQESGKRRYFFVDVGRIFSCPRIGGNYSVPLQEPVPLNNSVPLQEPVADGYRKIEGTGTESCTRREQLKEQEENSIVNDVYGKQGLPSTTITGTVNDVYGKGKQRLPITDKEQIKNRQVLIDDFQPHAQDEVAPTMGVTPTVNPSPHDGQGVAPTMGLTGSPHGGGCKRKEKRKEKESSKTSFSIPRPEDVPEQLWADFVTHRKAKKAPITETVIKRTRSEAAKCSMTLSQAIEMMVARGWQGFEARFVLKDTPRNPFCPNYRESTPAPNPAHNPFIPRRAKTPEELQAEKEQREAEELFGGLFR